MRYLQREGGILSFLPREVLWGALYDVLRIIALSTASILFSAVSVNYNS